MAGVRGRFAARRGAAIRGRTGISSGFRPGSATRRGAAPAIGRWSTADRRHPDSAWEWTVASTRDQYTALRCWPDLASDKSAGVDGPRTGATTGSNTNTLECRCAFTAHWEFGTTT